METAAEKKSRTAPKIKRPRAFDRGGFLGFRLPREDKAKIVDIARRSRRDLSSLALEWVTRGIAEKERELAKAG